MNPLVLFDYVYYRIAYLYENTYYRITGYEFPGIAILSAAQLFNALSLLTFYKPIDKLVGEPIVYILGSLLLILLNFIRYKKIVNYTELSLKWDKEASKIRLIKATGILCYFVFSILIFLFLGLNAIHR